MNNMDVDKNNDKEQKHVFSTGYEERKNRILKGISDVDKVYAGDSQRKHCIERYSRFARVAMVLLCGVILLPVSIHAAVTVYKFTVQQNGHTATGTIQVNDEDSASDSDKRTENNTKKSSGTTNMDEIKDVKGSDGVTYSIDTGKRYVEIDLGYLPAGLVRIEGDKYDMPDRESDMGITVTAIQWDGSALDIVNRDVEAAQSLNAGEYEYLLFERGGVNYSFDRLAYIPVKEKSIIVAMYIGCAITQDDLTRIVANMTINEDIGDDPARWTMVEDTVDDDAGSDDEENGYASNANVIFTRVDVNEEFIRSGYKMTVNDIRVYDNTCGIPKKDIMYWYTGIDSRFVDDDGRFKTVGCRRMKETTDDAFSEWEDNNKSSLRMISVEMTYQYAMSGDVKNIPEALDFSLDRGELTATDEMKSPDVTNYYYSGEQISAQNSKKMTFPSPVYADLDGRKTEVTDISINMINDGEQHDLTVYFLVDENEVADSYMSVCGESSYSQMYDCVMVYLGGGN